MFQFFKYSVCNVNFNITLWFWYFYYENISLIRYLISIFVWPFLFLFLTPYFISDVQLSDFGLPSATQRLFSCNNPASSTQTFGYSNDPLTGGEFFYETKTNQNNFQADANYFQIAATDNDTTDGSHAQPRNQSEKVCHPSPPRPLPPVPNPGRSRPTSQQFQNQQLQNFDQPPSQEPYPVKPMQISQTRLKYGHQAVKSTALWKLYKYKTVV